MKQPTKPTLKQKKKISNAGLNWKNWAVIDENDDGELYIINKLSKKTRKICRTNKGGK